MFVYYSQIRLKGLGQSLVLLIFVLNKLIKELRIRGFWNYRGESQTVVPVHACVWRGMRQCSTVTIADGGKGTCTKNVWFNKMQNECNLCLVGAVETE